jgi:hypothetical protein
MQELTHKESISKIDSHKNQESRKIKVLQVRLSLVEHVQRSRAKQQRQRVPTSFQSKNLMPGEQVRRQERAVELVAVR